MSCQHLLGNMGPKLRRGAGLEGENVDSHVGVTYADAS